jgi:hypothetical protein
MSPIQRLVLLEDALSHIGTFLLSCGREDAEYHVFEEFDADCVSFLHESNLRILQESGLISREGYEMSLRLAQAFRAMEGTELWNPEAVSSSEKWRVVLELGDTVREIVKFS